MSVVTSFDEKRYELGELVGNAYKLARELYTGDDIWGYENMTETYVDVQLLEIVDLLKKVKRLI